MQDASDHDEIHVVEVCEVCSLPYFHSDLMYP